MNYCKTFTIAGLLVMVVALSQCKSPASPAPQVSVATIEDLGRHIFFDTTLSNPGGQSCASCHDSSTAFSAKNHDIVVPGAIPSLSGNRNAPSIAYSKFSPSLYWSATDSSYVGGQFLDGRANLLEDQAKGPFLNHLEMNNQSRQAIIVKVMNASYFSEFQQVYGTVTDTNDFYNDMASAIATFERGPSFAHFTSKFDAYLNGKTTLTAQELHGLQLFNDSTRANCRSCHSTSPDSASGKVLFTNMTYHNLGVPKNPDNPYYKMDPSINPDGAAYIDRGLGGFLGNPEFDGFFKTPTLRNVPITGPYFHNGFFQSLSQVVHWYNVRDSATKAGGFPPPEVPGNIETKKIGNLGLSPQDEADIVEFLSTLTDGYK